jgi:uncharacterized iron-regulated membrane protein
MSIRRAIFWLHLAAGCIAGAVVLLMSVTGVLLMYERQLVAWADGSYRSSPRPGAAVLTVEQLLTAVRASRPGAVPTALTLSADRAAPVTVALGRADVVFLDAYDGRILGEGSRAARSFFQSVVGWHRWLGAEGEARATGRAITGASNLAFLVLVTSGVVLWWPRERAWRAVRAVALYRGGLEGRARDFNWHNVTGIWLSVPLVLIVVSGAVISYPWASDLVYRALGETPPPRAGRPGNAAAAARGMEPARSGERTPASFDGLSRALARSQAQVPGWQTIVMRLPEGDAPVNVTIDTVRGAVRPDRRAQLVLDRRTGEVVRFEPYSSQSPARRLRGWLRWVHTGEAAGIWGQTLAGVASAGAALLVWTGLAMAWRRLRAWQQRPERRVPSPEPRIEPSLQGESS